jgi:hypothetical protein
VIVKLIAIIVKSTRKTKISICLTFVQWELYSKNPYIQNFKYLVVSLKKIYEINMKKSVKNIKYQINVWRVAINSTDLQQRRGVIGE